MEGLQAKDELQNADEEKKKRRTPKRGDSSPSILHSSWLSLRGHVLYCATTLFLVQTSSIAGLRYIAREIMWDFEFQCMSTGLTMWGGLIFVARHDTCTSSRRPAKLLILYASFVSYKE